MTKQTNWKEITGVEPYVMWTYKGDENMQYFHDNEKCWYFITSSCFVEETNNHPMWIESHKDQMIILTPQAKPFDLCTFFGVEEGQEWTYSQPYMRNEGYKYKIENNTIMYKDITMEEWADNYEGTGFFIRYQDDMTLLPYPQPTYPEIMKKAAQGAIDNGFNWVARDKDEELYLYPNKPTFNCHSSVFTHREEDFSFYVRVDKAYYPTLKEGERLNLYEIVK